jgi:molybdate transport system regulatory protein
MIEIECHIFIKRNGICFLDAQKTNLLKEILQSGTLRGAAKKISISYQHAWNIIEELNRLSPEPVVIKQRGGTKGGGTEISIFGQRLLREYQQIEAHINKLVQQMNTEINF